MMWGGLDFSKVAQLGSQLGDAIQRAKNEIDKLDGPFAFDSHDKSHGTGNSDPGIEQDDFSVDAGGLFIPTGHAQRKATAQQADAAVVEPKSTDTYSIAAGASKESSSPASSKLRQELLPESAVSPSFPANDASGTGKAVKKKIIKKVVRKVPSASSDTTASAGVAKNAADALDAFAEQQPPAVSITAADVTASRPGDDTGDVAAASTASVQQWQHEVVHAGSAEQSTSDSTSYHVRQSRPAGSSSRSQGSSPGKKEKLGKGLGAVKLIQQHPAELQGQHQQPEVHEQLQAQQQLKQQQLGQDQQAQQGHLQQLSVQGTVANQQQAASIWPDQDSGSTLQKQGSNGLQEQQQEIDKAEHLHQQTQQQLEQLQAVPEQMQVLEQDQHLLREQAQLPQQLQGRLDLQQHQQEQQRSSVDIILDELVNELHTQHTNSTAAAHSQLQQQEQQQQNDICVTSQSMLDSRLQIAQIVDDRASSNEDNLVGGNMAAAAAAAKALEAQGVVADGMHLVLQPPLPGRDHPLHQAKQQQDKSMQGSEQQDQQQQQAEPALQLADEHQQQHHHSDRLISLLKQQCHDLQQQLVQREQQLSRQAEQLGVLEANCVALEDSKQQMEAVVVQLTAKNEQLAMRASRVNEEEMQAVQQEASERLAAAERKVFALIKERDALKRAASAAAPSSANPADMHRLEAELRKKDELVTQLMEEGQNLSKRQLELESSIKRLRASLKASEGEKDKLNTLLAAEKSEAESLRRAKAKAERDLVAAVEAGRHEVEAARQSAEEQLLKAKADQAAAEATAAEAAAEGLAGSLKASEARCAALADSVAELQEALERQRASADLREEMLRQDLADLERRAQAAELRHQELSAKLPEATLPLLRQMSALHDANTAQAQAWAAAERTLTARVRDAEAAAAAAAESQRNAEERLTAMQARLAAAEQAASNARSAATEATTRASRANERLALTESQLQDAQAAAEEAQAVSAQLRDDLKQLEAALQCKLSNEKAARRAAEEELTRVRQELSQLQGMLGPGVYGAGVSGGGFGASGSGLSQAPSLQANGAWRNTAISAAGPPALAAPGLKWVLVKEGEEASKAVDNSSQLHGNADDHGRSLPGTPHSVIESLTGLGHSTGKQLVRELSTATSSVQGFDTTELLQHAMSDTASISEAASPSRSSSVQHLHQQQLRQVQQRLGSGTVGEAQLQRLRAALRQKVGECAALESRLRELEETRDQLASELVQATHAAEKASDAVTELPKLQAAYQDLEARYVAAVELVGERDEQLEELQNDLEDVKQLFRQQIETLLSQQ